MVRFKNRYLLFEILPIKPTDIELNEKDISEVSHNKYFHS